MTDFGDKDIITLMAMSPLLQKLEERLNVLVETWKV